jgi:hypothetical protein
MMQKVDPPFPCDVFNASLSYHQVAQLQLLLATRPSEPCAGTDIYSIASRMPVLVLHSEPTCGPRSQPAFIHCYANSLPNSHESMYRMQ